MIPRAIRQQHRGVLVANGFADFVDRLATAPEDAGGSASMAAAVSVVAANLALPIT